MLIYLFLFFTGAAFASFIHVYVTRTLKGESIVKPRSHCTFCNHTLKPYELIPVVSYIVQRGRCSKCNHKIGADSFISEVILGSLFVIIYMIYGYTYESLIGFLIACMLLSICLSDFKEMIILDSTLVFTGICYYGIIFASLGLRGMYKSFLYGVFGFVLLFLVKIIGDKVFMRESLGGGDIKLAFIMGSILPYNLFLIALISGSFFALPYAIYTSSSKNSRELAFGPFLVLGLLVVFLFKNDIINMLNSVLIIERLMII